MSKVTLRDGEHIEKALKRFKRKNEQAGTLKELRKREHYIKPSAAKKIKQRAAAARDRKRLRRMTQSNVIG